MKIFILLLSILLLPFSSTNLFLNDHLMSTLPNIQQKDEDLDYIYHDQEIIKEFYQPIEYSKEYYLPNGKAALFLENIYKTKLEFQLPEYDLNLISKEILISKLDFDLEIIWEGPKQNGAKTLETHLFQILDSQSFQTPLVCGEIPWDSAVFKNLKIKPLLEFSWGENKSLVLEHKLNEFLSHDQLIFLISSENNGLAKMNFKISNLRLIYQIPEIFNQVSQVKLNLEYLVDKDSLLNINQMLETAILENEELKELQFTNYFQVPVLTIDQKQALLNISNDFFLNLQVFLTLQPKYQEKIFDPLITKFFLNPTFFQNIDLTKLALNLEIKIKPNDNPQKYFLEKNIHYKDFFERFCEFKVENNYLKIKPKNEYQNLSGNLNLLIEIEEEIIKKDLNELSLTVDLGVFNLKNKEEILQEEDVFTRWQELNKPILDAEIIQDYSLIKMTESNLFLIVAKEENKYFKGSCKVNFEINYLEEPKIDLSTLGLETDMGELEIVTEASIWEKFLTLNESKIMETNPDSYEIELSENDNNGLIRATEENPKYFGELSFIFTQKNSEIDDSSKDGQEEETTQKGFKEFFYQYWWVLIFILIFIGLLVWFLIKLIRQKKLKKTNF